MRHTWGGSGRPVAVVLPGSGSNADFVTRAFGPPLAAAGYSLVTADPVPGPDVIIEALDGLGDAVRRYDVRLVGGVSLGAQLAVRWAAASASAARLDGMLLAVPAWTGPPGAVAAASAAAAAEVEAYGIAEALRRARQGGVGWVLDELSAAWPRYGADLQATLRAAAVCPGPTVAELSRIGAPAGLVAFADDPLHPLAVAEQWAAALPHAALEVLRLGDLESDRAILGSAALRALRRAGARRARAVTSGGEGRG